MEERLGITKEIRGKCFRIARKVAFACWEYKAI